MGKALRNIILYSALAAGIAGAFLVGRTLGNKNQEKPKNSIYLSSETSKKQADNQAKNSLENYLLTGRELDGIILRGDTKNSPFIMKDFIKGYNLPPEYSEKILTDTIGMYIMPQIEAGSERSDIALKILEFKSTRDREDFVRDIAEEIPYPVFTKENFIALIEPTIKDSENLSSAQKARYDFIISEYVKRTGMDVVFSKDPAEQEELTKNIIGDLPNNLSNNIEENNSGLEVSNFNSVSANSSAVNNTNTANSPSVNTAKSAVNNTSDSSSVSAEREPANITSGSLEDFLLKDKELRFAELSDPPVSYHKIEEGGSVAIPIELFKRDFNFNPAIVESREESGNIREFFDNPKLKNLNGLTIKSHKENSVQESIIYPYSFLNLETMKQQSNFWRGMIILVVFQCL
jgi:hypothetical protein